MTEIRKGFHEELAELCSDTARLGRLVGDAIDAGTDALLREDLPATAAVIAGDLKIDDLAHHIEDRIYEVLARQQPMATDLRLVVTVLRTVHELERIGDLMANVAKGARRLYPYKLEGVERSLVNRMRQQAVEQLKVSVQAFVDRDAKRASALADMDDTMDDLQKDLFRAIFAWPVREEASIQRAVQIALVGRFFERIADHTVNIGERVAYMVTGEFHSSDARATEDETRAAWSAEPGGDGSVSRADDGDQDAPPLT